MAGGLRIARRRFDIPGVSRSEVLRYLGHHGQALAPELETRLDDVTARCLRIARPRATIASFLVREVTPTSVSLVDCALRLTGSDIAELLASAHEVVLFAATLGADVDRELRRLAATDALEQVLFDAVATALVERTTDAAEAVVRAYAAETGAFAGQRYSPGYGDLPLSVQRPFLAALDATRQLGITLTPSDLMVPTKSVTAVVGLHATPQEGFETGCARCDLADFCTLRDTARSCHG